MSLRFGLINLFVCLLWALNTTVAAQAPPPLGEDPPGFDDPFNTQPGFGDPMGDPFGKRVTFSGSYRIEKDSRNGLLSIRASIQSNWHLYSTTQPSGGPQATKITIVKSPDFDVTGDLKPDSDPLIHEDDAFPGVMVEELIGEVSWTVPIRVSDAADLEKLSIQVKVDGQVCETGGMCELVSEELTSFRFGGYYEPAKATGRYEDKDQHVTILGHVEPKVGKPGDTIKLVLSAQLAPEWHVYRHAATDPQIVSKPTMIVLRKASGWKYTDPIASAKATEKESGLAEEPILYYHEGSISWTISIEVPKDAKAGQYELAGAIAYQTCTSSVCDQPTGAQFQVTVTIGDQVLEGKVPLAFSPTTYQQVASQAIAQLERKGAQQTVDIARSKPETTWGDKSLAMVLTFAFLAGLALNIMPCVLPVIGLKIMSFVQQAGGSRWEIFSLNMWFSLGLLSIFWILAGAAAFANKGWGQHFESVAFTVTMIGIVFAFGLSFLGIWEIPIPGFVSGSTVQGAAAKEGAVGAFSKGVLSTILATPCAGPLIVPAVSWAITQPAPRTFLAFTFIGLGMATPYLLVGAFPRLIGFLPKPGDWMETFKHWMGFLLMGTVIWLFTSLGPEWVIPTLTLLLGLGIACWLVGKIPMTATLGKKFASWSYSTVIVVLAAIVGFVLLAQTHEWEPYTRVALDQHLKEGRTVLVDFTANW